MGGECDGGFLSCAHREARSGFSLLIGTNRVQYFSLESQGCGTSTPVWCGSESEQNNRGVNPDFCATFLRSFRRFPLRS